MRLPNGIHIENEATFGELRFSALRREVYERNEDGTVSTEVKERSYDLKCKAQGCMITVGVPASVPLHEYEYNALVELVNPVVDTVASATFGNNAEADWYIKADDIVLKRGGGNPPQQQDKQPGKPNDQQHQQNQPHGDKK